MPVRFIHKKRSKITYCDTPLYLDVETSHNEDNTKCWIVSIQVLFDDHYHLFRKPEELMNYFLDLIDRMKLDPSRKLICYIHNASYDLAYLLPYIQKYLPFKDERKGIYHGEHKIISYSQGGLEFRCTYLLSGQSLEKWSKEMNVEHQKQVGLYDYSKKIFQDSELDQNELIYDMYDVLAMSESFDKQLKIHNDYICTVPLTSTGYARRLLRQECEADPTYRNDYFLANRIDIDTMLSCLNAYAGGYTHNNRWLKSKVIIKFKRIGRQLIGGIGHRDFRSMYPSVIRCYPLPWGRPELYYDIREHEAYNKLHGHNMNIDDILDLYPAFSTISAIRIYGLSLKDREHISMPFFQVSKMFDRDNVRYHADNGRVLTMYEGSFTTYIDNHTLKIIKEQYNIKYKVINVIRFRNKKLPEPIARTIDKLFADKSNYKILHNKYRDMYGEFDPRTIEAGFELMKSKKLLNSIYGCFAQNPIMDELDLDFEHYNENGELEPLRHITLKETREQKEEILNDYYNRRSSFLHYPIGVFTTAISRALLYDFIANVIGYDNTLYCDTDSIFYISSPEIEAKIEAKNKEKEKKAAYIINSEGKKIYYDVFEKEPDLIAFKGLHSKCYGYITEKNELKLVVAGVPERTIVGLDQENEPVYLTREDELKGITTEMLMNPHRKDGSEHSTENKHIRRNIIFLDKLKDKTKFRVNSGVTAKYIADVPHTEIIEGHEVSTAGGCIISKLEEKLVHDWDFLDDVNLYFSDFENDAL